MNWFKKIAKQYILKISQLWAVEQGKDNTSFADILEMFYELEYKLSMIKNFSFSGMEKRKENIIDNLQEKKEKIMERLLYILLNLYEQWLSSHAILHPPSWAKDRAKRMILESDLLLEDSIDIFLSEYKAYNSSNLSIPALFEKILALDIDSINNFKSALEEDLEQMLLRDYEEEELCEIFNLEDCDQIENYISEIDFFENEAAYSLSVEPFISSTSKNSLVHFLESWFNSDDLVDVFTVLFQKELFDGWYDYWREQGIDEVRENIENVYNKLKNVDKDNFENVLQEAIQVAHVNGFIMDYLVEFGGDVGDDFFIISEKMRILTEGIYNHNWDEELLEAGVEIPKEVQKSNYKKWIDEVNRFNNL